MTELELIKFQLNMANNTINHLENTREIFLNKINELQKQNKILTEKLKIAEEAAISLNTRVTQQSEKKYNISMDALILERKLKIAEKALNSIAYGRYIPGYLIWLAEQALQKMEEVKNVNI